MEKYKIHKWPYKSRSANFREWGNVHIDQVTDAQAASLIKRGFPYLTEKTSATEKKSSKASTKK